MEELVKHIRALLLLQIASLQGTSGVVKLELLLADSGFTHREIAEMVGKSTVAVAKAISRGRATRRITVSASESTPTEEAENG